MQNFLSVYANLDKDSLETLDSVYREDIRFIDPAHEIHGREALKKYFAALYANIASIRFDFQQTSMSENQGFVKWLMTFSHPKLKKGRPIRVEGVSYLEFDDDGRVRYHRDYFDLGAMLYEHIPLLGTMINAVKRRLGS